MIEHEVAVVQLIGIVVIVVAVTLGIWVMSGGAEKVAGTAPLRWMVKLEQGKVTRFEGDFPPVGWRDVHEIATSRALTGVIRYRGPAAVEFSDSIGPEDRQRLLNVLARGPASGCIPGPKG